jgi:diadenosine tetraphosphate (Ap4A) HIT family hydrolase
MSPDCNLLVLNLTINVGMLQGSVENTVHFHLVPILKNRLASTPYYYYCDD